MDDVTSRLLAARMAGKFAGWLTCADCSSLGMDKAIGKGPAPASGECSSCGGHWPLRPVERGPAQRIHLVSDE